MAKVKHKAGKSTTAAKQEVNIRVLMRPNEPVILIDGAVLKPGGNMMELILLKSEHESDDHGEVDPAKSPNACQGRYAMTIEAFLRLADLLGDMKNKILKEQVED